MNFRHLCWKHETGIKNKNYMYFFLFLLSFQWMWRWLDHIHALLFSCLVDLIWLMIDNPNLQSLPAESETFPVKSVIVPVETRTVISAGKIVDPTSRNCYLYLHL